MRKAALVALVFVTVACGAYQFPGSTPPATTTPATGTVSGTVVAVPCTPVETAPPQCAGRPVAGLEIDFAHGEASAKAVTDTGGHYSVVLSSETWTVHLKTYMRIISGPLEVDVPAGTAVSANYVLDSGIRVPVPAPQQ
jgi:hypothetical protein